MKNKNILDRLMSLAYDYIFVSLVLLVITVGLNVLNQKMIELKHIWYYMIGINVFIYFIMMPMIYKKLEGSLGKSLNDLYVVPTKGKITYGRILFREIIMKQLLYLTLIGIIVEIVFYLVKKETLHDYYLKTTVKKKKELKNK